MTMLLQMGNGRMYIKMGRYDVKQIKEMVKCLTEMYDLSSDDCDEIDDYAMQQERTNENWN